MARYVILTDEAGSKGQAHRFGVPEHLLASTRPRSCCPGLLTLDLDMHQLREVTRDKDIVAIAPVMPISLIAPVEPTSSIPHETPKGWSAQALNLPTRCQVTDSPPIVAILDTGLDQENPAFDGTPLVTRDFVGTGMKDIHGHGTHIAGTILGQPHDGISIGLLPNISAGVIAKILNYAGLGVSQHLFEGLLWAADQASIICTSVYFDTQRQMQDLIHSGLPRTQAFDAALSATYANQNLLRSLITMLQHPGPGLLVFSGAGNSSRRTEPEQYETGSIAPMYSPGLLTVGAVRYGPDGTLLGTHFSNTGASMVAPGENILSAASGGGLCRLSGTSMAAAYAAAMAALWWQTMPNVRANQVAEQILSACDTAPLCRLLAPYDYGAGLVQGPAAEQSHIPKPAKITLAEQPLAQRPVA
jgi:subtilisin family serine protease